MDQLDASWGLKNGDLVQQLAMLKWMDGSADGKQMMERVTKFRVAYEMYQRMSGQKEIDALQAATISSVANYVKSNPRASEDEMVREISKIVKNFETQVKSL